MASGFGFSFGSQANGAPAAAASFRLPVVSASSAVAPVRLPLGASSGLCGQAVRSAEQLAADEAARAHLDAEYPQPSAAHRQVWDAYFAQHDLAERMQQFTRKQQGELAPDAIQLLLLTLRRVVDRLDYCTPDHGGAAGALLQRVRQRLLGGQILDAASYDMRQSVSNFHSSRAHMLNVDTMTPERRAEYETSCASSEQQRWPLLRLATDCGEPTVTFSRAASSVQTAATPDHPFCMSVDDRVALACLMTYTYCWLVNYAIHPARQDGTLRDAKTPFKQTIRIEARHIWMGAQGPFGFDDLMARLDIKPGRMWKLERVVGRRARELDFPQTQAKIAHAMKDAWFHGSSADVDGVLRQCWAGELAHSAQLDLLHRFHIRPVCYNGRLTTAQRTALSASPTISVSFDLLDQSGQTFPLTLNINPRNAAVKKITSLLQRESGVKLCTASGNTFALQSVAAAEFCTFVAHGMFDQQPAREGSAVTIEESKSSSDDAAASSPFAGALRALSIDDSDFPLQAAHLQPLFGTPDLRSWRRAFQLSHPTMNEGEAEAAAIRVHREVGLVLCVASQMCVAGGWIDSAAYTLHHPPAVVRRCTLAMLQHAFAADAIAPLLSTGHMPNDLLAVIAEFVQLELSFLPLPPSPASLSSPLEEELIAFVEIQPEPPSLVYVAGH